MHYLTAFPHRGGILMFPDQLSFKFFSFKVNFDFFFFFQFTMQRRSLPE